TPTQEDRAEAESSRLCVLNLQRAGENPLGDPSLRDQKFTEFAPHKSAFLSILTLETPVGKPEIRLTGPETPCLQGLGPGQKGKDTSPGRPAREMRMTRARSWWDRSSARS